jgi:hypothetical protein
MLRRAHLAAHDLLDADSRAAGQQQEHAPALGRIH